MKAQLEFSRKMIQAYNEIFKPLCHKVKLSKTAIDILLFLANNPNHLLDRLCSHFLHWLMN